MWQPIETAPKDGTQVLVGHKTSGVFSAWWEEYGNVTNTGTPGWVAGDSNSDGHLVCYHPTHWMPLPEPPAE